MRWFRFYDDALNDPKVQRLDPELFKFWVNCLCLASKGNGLLPVTCNVAFVTRVTEMDADSRLQALISAGLLDDTPKGLMPHNWKQRQYVSDSSVERVRAYRKRKREGVTLPKRYSDAAEQIQIQNKPLSPLKKGNELFEEFWKIYPRKVARGSASRAFAKAIKKTPHTDIIEAVKLFAAKCVGKEPEFIPHAATWLNAERWSDAELKPTPSISPSRHSPQPGETREEYIRRCIAMNRA